jgi:hypothetical protein
MSFIADAAPLFSCSIKSLHHEWLPTRWPHLSRGSPAVEASQLHKVHPRHVIRPRLARSAAKGGLSVTKG